MRGEVLSSVELVLPSAVVETCYNIKRDVQARFQAVNSEEKTKSEITVEKQADDSVKISVIVVSLTCLTDEEISEEVAFDIPDKENTRRAAGRGRRRVRRKGRQPFTRKPKGWTKKKPVNIQPLSESVETPLTEGVSDEEKQKEFVAKPGELNNEDSVAPTQTNQVSDINKEEAEVPVIPISTKSSRGKGVRRGGRGRRGRSFGGRRGIGRRATATEIAFPSDSSYEPNSVVTDNSPTELIETVPKELDEEAAEVQTDKLPESDLSIPISDVPIESQESDVNAVITKARGKRVRRNTDKSSQGDAEEGVSPPKVSRPKRKAVKPPEEGHEPASESSTPANEKSLTKGEEPSTLIKAKKGVKKGFKRKRKVNASSNLPDTGDSTTKGPETEAKNLEAEPENPTVVNKPSPEQELSKEEPDTQKTKAAKGRSKPKIIRITEVGPSTEQLSENQNDDVSVQSQTSAVVPPQNSNEGVEDVTAAIPVIKRKGRKPKVKKRGRPPQSQKLLPVEPSPVEIPIEPFRVKTKAQLKQKPTELANFSDNEADISINNTPDGPEYIDPEKHSSVVKHVAKKPVQKPKSLARIWRTRKKSGFTHKKKSKLKPAKDSTAVHNEKQTADIDINQKINGPSEPVPHDNRVTNPPELLLDSESAETINDPSQLLPNNKRPSSPSEHLTNNKSDNTVNDAPELLPNIKGNNDDITEDQTQRNCDISEDLKEKSFIKEDTRETEKEKPMPDLGQRQIEEHKRLPQKKRHTAKLAAERQKAVDEANACSETLAHESLVQVAACTVTNTQSNSVNVDVSSLDLYSTCTDFNETNAIESLIQLSNATDESLNTYRGTVQYEEQLSIEQVPSLINGLTALDPPVLKPEIEGSPRDEVSTAVQSITERETEAAIENITDLPPATPGDVINELMKIATASKDTATEVSDEPQESRPGKRPYKREFKVQCRFCQVKVKDYGYLFRHVKKLHRDKGIEMKQHLEEIRPLMRTPCPICHKMVSSISNISSHIKQCHASKDSAVLCPICKKTYKTTVSLRQHLRQCHQTQQHRFFCHLCSANFTEKRSLKEHINCSHETTQVFQCDDCGKSFLTKGRLRRHRYIHGDYRHKCSYCGKGFHLKDNMNKHIEIVHEKSQGKRFVCPHCDKKFTVKGNMTQHVMGVHLKQFQYTCPQCQTGFRRKKDMLAHMVKHEEGDVPNNQLPPDMSEESSNNELDDKSIDSPWHGRGEKTEVITGLADNPSSADGGMPNKTKVIIISPLVDYPSS